MAYTPEQLAHYREQIRRSKELMSNGMSPEEAEMEAAKQMIAERRKAAASISAGNGADIDNLAGAATPLAVEPTVGRLAPAQEDRVFADDPTGGNASILAARAAADAERAAWYNSPEGPGGSAAADTERWYQTFGDARTPETRANMTPVQVAARNAQVKKEQQLRQRPEYLAMQARRLADRTGRPETEVLAMLESVGDGEDADFGSREEAVTFLNAEARDLQRADLARRQQAVVRRRMAQTNPLEYIQRNDVDDWGKYVAANAMLGNRGPQTDPFEVEKFVAAARAQQEARMATGAGGRNLTPEQAEIAQEAARRKMRQDMTPRERAEDAVRSGLGPFAEAVLNYAEGIVDTHYSQRIPGASTTPFSDEEIAPAAELLAQDLNMPLADAMQTMRRLQQQRSQRPYFIGDAGARLFRTTRKPAPDQEEPPAPTPSGGPRRTVGQARARW